MSDRPDTSREAQLGTAGRRGDFLISRRCFLATGLAATLVPLGATAQPPAEKVALGLTIPSSLLLRADQVIQ